MKSKIQNTAKTPVNNKYGKFLQTLQYIVPYFYLSVVWKIACDVPHL